MPRQRTLALLLFLASWALAYGTAAGKGFTPAGDGYTYYTLAHGLRYYGTFTLIDQPCQMPMQRAFLTPCAEYEPLQPAFIAATQFLGDRWLYLTLASFFVAAGIAFWFLAARIWFGRDSWIPWALWGCLLFPNLLYLHVRMYRREPLFCLLTAASAFLLSRAWTSGRRLECLGAGLTLGLAILTKSVWLVLLPALALLWLLAGKRLAGIALVLAGAAAVVVPWTVRNRVSLHSAVTVSSLGGLGFMLNNVHGMDPWQTTHKEVYLDIPKEIAGDEGAIDRLVFRRKLAVLAREPRLALRILCVNAAHTAYPVMDAYYPDPADNTARLNPALLFAYAGILLGLWAARLRPPPPGDVRWIPLLMLGVYLGVCLAFQGSPTYRTPLEPVLIAFGLWGWSRRPGVAVWLFYAACWLAYFVLTIPVRKALVDGIWRALAGIS